MRGVASPSCEALSLKGHYDRVPILSVCVSKRAVCPKMKPTHAEPHLKAEIPESWPKLPGFRVKGQKTKMSRTQRQRIILSGMSWTSPLLRQARWHSSALLWRLTTRCLCSLATSHARYMIHACLLGRPVSGLGFRVSL